MQTDDTQDMRDAQITTILGERWPDHLPAARALLIAQHERARAQQSAPTVIYQRNPPTYPTTRRTPAVFWPLMFGLLSALACIVATLAGHFH